MDAKKRIGNASLVNIDYTTGVNEALKHLVELGHTRIAFISGPLGLGSARTRAEAFRAGLRVHGLKAEKRWVQEGDHRVEGGRAAMERVLSADSRPTAVLASNDLTAIGAMDAIREHGLRIPEDISVIGFDDIQLSAFTQPPLTTVHVPRGEVAATAFRSLFREKDEVPAKRMHGQEHVIQPHLLVRGSTAMAKKA
jgi:LacI family transcriptional regulator